jgi:hypothetical protein
MLTRKRSPIPQIQPDILFEDMHCLEAKEQEADILVRNLIKISVKSSSPPLAHSCVCKAK